MRGGGHSRTSTFRKAAVSSGKDRGWRVRFQAGHPLPGCEMLNTLVSQPHWPPVKRRKVVGASLIGDSNEEMDEEHQHSAGGRGRSPVSRLSSLSFKVCPSLLPSDWPRSPPMPSLGSLPKCCPTAHSRLNANKSPASNTHLQARGTRWPHGSLISLESGGKRKGERRKLIQRGSWETCPIISRQRGGQKRVLLDQENGIPGHLPGPPRAGAPPVMTERPVTQGLPHGCVCQCPPM